MTSLNRSLLTLKMSIIMCLLKRKWVPGLIISWSIEIQGLGQH